MSAVRSDGDGDITAGLLIVINVTFHVRNCRCAEVCVMENTATSTIALRSPDSANVYGRLLAHDLENALDCVRSKASSVMLSFAVRIRDPFLEYTLVFDDSDVS